MLRALFDFSELKNLNESQLSFAILLMNDIESTILCKDEAPVKAWLHQRGLQVKSVAISKYESISHFMIRYSDKCDTRYLIVSDKIFDCNKYGEQFTRCSYSFGDIPREIRDISFTEHAKNKILYNELSWLYMDAIANDTSLEVSFLQKVLKQNHAIKIIDCCCGVGRHAVRLGELGFKVTGVDVSQAQIDTAVMHNSCDNVEYLVRDARNFNLICKNYDAAICMWTTYNYFSKDEDLFEVLSTLHSHIRKGGIIILDSKNIPAMNKERLYHRVSRNDKMDMTLLVYKRILDSVQMSRYFYFLEIDGKLNFYLDEEYVRFYYLSELKTLGSRFFNLIDVYGDFDGNSFDPKNSKRMITVWRNN